MTMSPEGNGTKASFLDPDVLSLGFEDSFKDIFLVPSLLPQQPNTQ